MNEPVIRVARLADLSAAAHLVQRVVRECVGRWFEAQAIDEYCEFAAPDQLASRFEAGHKFWIAIVNGKIVGALEIKGAGHVLMLFVAPENQRRGVGRALLMTAFPGFPNRVNHEITVNSVPQSLPAYQRMGFVRDGDEQNVRGIRFIPMIIRKATAT